MSKTSEPFVIVWPMCQFQKDYQTFEKIGEGHYGKRDADEGEPPEQIQQVGIVCLSFQNTF